MVLLSPDDKTLFVSNGGFSAFSNTITVFSTASNGSLSLVVGSPFPMNPGASGPLGTATSQDGSLLYVAIFFSNSISVFSVASNGALTEVAGSPFPTGQPGGLLSLAAFPPKSCIVQTPTITSISPTSAIAGGAGFTLTVNGTNFVSGSTVNFNGNARTTTFVSATQLRAAILASDIATTGIFNVTVTNPGDGTSNGVSFTVVTPQQAMHITSNFNGTPIPSGDYIWFNANVTAKGIPSTGATIFFQNSTIHYGTTTLVVPNAQITFSPSTTCATTTFNTATNTWITTVPISGSDEILLSGLPYKLTDSLAGGTNPVTWTGTFTSKTAGITVNWKWGAAVYTTFSSDYNLLNIKPTHGASCSYNNSDHAGTPEGTDPTSGQLFKSFVTGGARGGGGSNFTGSWSGTVSVPVSH